MKNLLLLWTLTIIQGLPAPYYRVLVLPYNVPPPVHLNTSEFETYNLPPTRTPKQIIETRFVNFSPNSKQNEKWLDGVFCRFF